MGQGSQGNKQAKGTKERSEGKGQMREQREGLEQG